MFDLFLSLLILLPFGILVLKESGDAGQSGVVPACLAILAIPLGVLMAHQGILWTSWNSRLLWAFGVVLCVFIARPSNKSLRQWLQSLKELGIHVALVMGSVIPVAFP